MTLQPINPRDSYFSPSSPEDLSTAADILGCDVKYPASNQLFLDIDSDEGLAVTEGRLVTLKECEEHFGPITIEKTRSKTKGHWHVTVTIARDLGKWERLALQAALGSDPLRELLACLKQRDGEPGTTCFFEPKPGHHQVPEMVIPQEQRDYMVVSFGSSLIDGRGWIRSGE